MSKDGKIIFGRIYPKQIKAILFDVDGTLSNTDDRMVARLATFLKPISWFFKNQDPHKFSRRVVMAMETPGNLIYTIADRIGIDAPIARYFRWLSQRRQPKKIVHDCFWIIPGVYEMLEYLAASYPLGVVSARDAGSTQHFLDFFNLTAFFQVIVTSQSCTHTKPFPDPVIYAAQRLAVNPETCVMIGDTVVDIQSGKSAGAQTIGVLCGFGTEKELKRVGANMILSATTDITSVL